MRPRPASGRDIGNAAGDRIQYGADIVGGSLGVSLGAVSATGFVDAPTPCGPLAVNAGFCSNSTAYDATRLAPWQLTFSEGPASLTVTGPSLAGAVAVPFPESVTLSGTGVTPTISWHVPSVFAPDGFRVQVFDKGTLRAGTGTADIIYSTALSPTASSFTLPTGIGLAASGSYVINFQVVETRGHVAFTNNNAQILSRSNAYFDFSPLSGTVAHDIALPTIDASGVYNFHVGSVSASSITYIDPLVATGYHYATGAGDPNFKSVLLPNVGDGIYTLSFVDALGAESVTLSHDVQYFFSDAGVGNFTITGIETSAGLDPSNATAFITGLSFENDGAFTGTMTPITTLVDAVPEPETYALLLIGMGLLGGVVKRRQTRPVPG
jgi:PEP-CTERM motif